MNSAKEIKRRYGRHTIGARTLFLGGMFMYQDALLFLTGSWAYPAIEMLWRGGDALLHGFGGGHLPVLDQPHLLRGLRGQQHIQPVPGGGGHHHRGGAGAGLVLNCLLGFDIWDYSNVPLNLLGQVCLPYSFLWMGISLPAMALCELCREDSLEEQARKIFTKKKR